MNIARVRSGRFAEEGGKNELRCAKLCTICGWCTKSRGSRNEWRSASRSQFRLSWWDLAATSARCGKVKLSSKRIGPGGERPRTRAAGDGTRRSFYFQVDTRGRGFTGIRFLCACGERAKKNGAIRWWPHKLARAWAFSLLVLRGGCRHYVSSCIVAVFKKEIPAIRHNELAAEKYFYEYRKKRSCPMASWAVDAVLSPPR